MPVKFQDESEGKFLAIQIRGKLTRADYVYFAPEFERLVMLNRKMRIWFDLTGFEGLEDDALWTGIKFGLEHFNDVERIAMIGDSTWQHGIAIFTKPFTRATVRFFGHAEVVAAERWLNES